MNNMVEFEAVNGGAMSPFMPHHDIAQREKLSDILKFRHRMVEDIQRVTMQTRDEFRALDYCFKGISVKEGGRFACLNAVDVLCASVGIAALDSECWRRAIDLTDVYEIMPAARRDEWDRHIREHTTPPFDEAHVLPTFESLLSSREKFFAERIDGIFRGLSRTHATNVPEGFRKRMIIPDVWDGMFTSFERVGVLSDLRNVIAKFAGNGTFSHNATDELVKYCAYNAPGEWVTVDGGAWRIRIYKGVGTAHVEIHDDMAWRLNAMLHTLYPTAIPDSNRRPEKAKKTKKHSPILNILPPEVSTALLGAVNYEKPTASDDRRQRVIYTPVPGVLKIRRLSDKKADRILVDAIAHLGGVPYETPDTGGTTWEFGYPALDVIKRVGASGVLPDYESHQYYPTPELIADEIIALAGIEPGHKILEPSAGIGNIVDRITIPDAVSITCVEYSGIHCDVLRSKGYHTIHGDFLEWETRERYDRILMNPPFSEGRWKAHVEAAKRLLAPGGKLLAIVPMSAEKQGHKKLMEWTNEFANTSIKVMLTEITEGS